MNVTENNPPELPKVGINPVRCDFHYRFFPLSPPPPLLLPSSLPRPVTFSLPEKILTLLFILLPLLVIPVYVYLARFLYPGAPLFPRFFRAVSYLRPPSGSLFFQEIFVLLLSILAVLFLQAILALILRKNGPWGETMATGSFLSLASERVTGDIKPTSTDTLFQPLSALGGAAIAWLVLSLIILYPHLRRVLGGRESYSEAQIRG